MDVRLSLDMEDYSLLAKPGLGILTIVKHSRMVFMGRSLSESDSFID